MILETRELAGMNLATVAPSQTKRGRLGGWAITRLPSLSRNILSKRLSGIILLYAS
jgi:hypothetical protein